MSSASDLTIDTAYLVLYLRYVDSTLDGRSRKGEIKWY